MNNEQLDALAAECWRESRYSGRDGQDFDHREFARQVLAAAAGERVDAPAYRNCEFCGCHTNAKVRACCEKGYAADRVPADAPAEPTVSLTTDEAAFLAARLRRLFAHHGYTLPDFASNDASLIRIAGSAIGAVLTLAASPSSAASASPATQPMCDEERKELVAALLNIAKYGDRGNTKHMREQIERAIAGVLPDGEPAAHHPLWKTR